MIEYETMVRGIEIVQKQIKTINETSYRQKYYNIVAG
jgi:hypothetical protein